MADPWVGNIGEPGKGYLGLGPAGYYIGRYLLGRERREEAARQQRHGQRRPAR